jgi:lipopolysaccharide export system protein LptA
MAQFMSISVERLRTVLLVGVSLLALVIAVFIGYGKYLAHRVLSNLPAKLGINITQETKSFTYSQSDGKRTIYTLHAAKSIQHSDGKYLLQDVGIVLYGKKQDRADRIYGKEFEYDPENGVIRGLGEVHIDLAAPAPATVVGKHDFAANGDVKGDATHETHDPRMIHVTTSGLVYLQKLGVAATDQPLEFEFHGLTGHATGADYNTDSGELLLHSAVDMSGLERGQPILLTAHSADLDRQTERVVLQHARYVVASPQGKRIIEGEKATAHLRSDGTAERVEAEGNVTLSNDDGVTVTAPRGEMTLSAQNQPQTAMMTGGVKLVEDEPLRQMQGEATESHVAFDKAGRPEHVVMTGAVHLHERQRVTASAVAVSKPTAKKTAAPARRTDTANTANVSWSDRDLVANQVELALVEGEGKRTELRDAKATGAAHLVMTGGAASGHAGATRQPSSAIAGDVLMAHFASHNGISEIQTLHGDGHTAVHRTSDLGVEDASAGDVLDATFYGSGHQPVKKATSVRKVPSDASRQEQTIASAVQVGHIVMTHKPVPKPGEAAAEERATGQRSVYDGDADTLTLTGGVQVTQPGGDLWADRMVMEQVSGDVAVDGAVKASYRQAGAAETVHVLASHGDLKHDSGVAFFYGVPGKLPRLWQGGSQVEAPVLRFDQKQRTLFAHGDGQGAPGAVHTTLVNAAPAKEPAKNSKTPKKQEVVRIASRELNYSDIARKAEFTGGVNASSADGTMMAQQATAFLQQPAAGSKANATPTPAGQAGFMGGQVERIVANGGVVLDQPGRKATGEQIVYTASDQMYVLTGTASAPPVVHDESQGTTTGCALRFHAGDNSVVVSNEGCSSRDEKVRSSTQVKDSNR